MQFEHISKGNRKELIPTKVNEHQVKRWLVKLIAFEGTMQH
jgi:hypothetical protein